MAVRNIQRIRSSGGALVRRPRGAPTRRHTMKIIGIVCVALSGLFLLNCVGEAPTSDSEAEDAQDEDTQAASQAVTGSCEGIDGTSCWPKGRTLACNNGTPDPGLCFCTGVWVCQ